MDVASLDFEKTKWEFSNHILYQMCKDNPLHIDENVIIGKILLIGRTYAAAIERRTNTSDDITGDDFYFQVVAPKMMMFGQELDASISGLKHEVFIHDGNVLKILELHYKLTQLFSEMSGKNKRSLASKYLHFHLPNLFYIFDSRADKALRKLVPIKNNTEVRDKKQLYNHCLCDKFYFDFFIKLYLLDIEIEKQTRCRRTPRELDSLLLSY